MSKNTWFTGKVKLGLALISLVVLLASSPLFGGMLDNVKSPLGKSKDTGSNVSRNDLDGLYALCCDADNLLQKSVDLTFNMLANKDELQKMELRMREANNIKDPKEKEAAINKIEQDKAALVQKYLDEQQISQKMQSLNAEQRKLLGNAIYNILLASLKDKDAVEKAQQLTQKIQANPAASTSYAGDLPKLKDIVTGVPPQADKAVTLGTNLTKVARANKIEVAVPKSSSDPKKEVDPDK